MMIVEYTKNRGKKKEADLYRVEDCLYLQVNDTTHCIKLSKGQWKLLAGVANAAQLEETK